MTFEICVDFCVNMRPTLDCTIIRMINLLHDIQFNDTRTQVEALWILSKLSSIFLYKSIRFLLYTDAHKPPSSEAD